MTAASRDPLEPLARALGQTLIGPWVQIETRRQAAYNEGAHHDVAYSDDPSGEYPDGLLDGFHLLGLLDWLSMPLVGSWHGLNYGLDRVRWTSPVTTNDRLRLRLMVDEMVDHPGGLLVTYDCIIEVEGRAKPGLVARWKVLLSRP